MKHSYLAAAAAAGLCLGLAGPALAGGLESPAAPAAVPVPAATTVVRTSAGNWTGFYGGLSIGYGDVSGSSTLGDDVDGLTYGGHVGYLRDMGNGFVLGGEVEFSGFDISDDSIGLDVDSVARAKLRAGYDAGAFLPYATAGGAFLTTSGAIDDEDWGYFYGAGVEYQLRDGIRLGAELLQHEFDDYADSGIDVEATTFAARVSFSF